MRLEALGLQVETAQHAWVHWRSLYVTDPEGNQVELGLLRQQCLTRYTDQPQSRSAYAACHSEPSVGGRRISPAFTRNLPVELAQSAAPKLSRSQRCFKVLGAEETEKQ